jgi:predicted acyltransferase
MKNKDDCAKLATGYNSGQEAALETPKHRLESIDQFRGFAIVTMVLANFTSGIHTIPAQLHHAPDVGLTPPDLVAPFFIFAIGLTYGLSARRRASRDGWGKTTEHFFRRFVAILGIGSLMVAIGLAYLNDPCIVNWGALHSIGVAGLVALLVIRLPTLWRLGVGAAVLGGYQVILDRYWVDVTVASPHGGIQGAVAWGGMLILSTVLADLFHDEARGRRVYPWVSLATLALGVGLAFLTPVSKHRVSASYVVINLGLSALLFWGFHLLNEGLRVRVPLLSAWGRNPLLLYLLHYIGIGLFYLPGLPILYTEAPLWVVGVELLILLAALSWVAWRLQRRGYIFSL